MTPTDLDLARMFNPQVHLDTAADRRLSKLYEACRSEVAELGKKLRDLLPEGEGKDAVFEELADMLPLVELAVAGKARPAKKQPKPRGGRVATQPLIAGPRIPVPQPPEVPPTPVVPPTPAVEPPVVVEPPPPVDPPANPVG